VFSKIFPRNEHTVERGIRVVLGVVVLSLAFVGPQTPWGFIGIIPIVTGFIGSCPLYTVLGFSTCPLNDAS
jgi:hypothetical protein